MERSEKIEELVNALSKFQGKMPAVKMDAENPFLKNKYATLGQVIETCTPILNENGLSFSQLVFSEGDKVGVETILFHNSGQWISSAVSLSLGDEKAKTLAQFAGSLVTYLRRYSLSSMLGIYSEEDKDGEGKKRIPEKDTQKEPTEHEKLIESILATLKELGGAKNEKLLTFMKEVAPPKGNPNVIKDDTILKDLIKKLEIMKKGQEKTND